MGYNVAIDGPAGAGKSTIARKTAKDLSYIYVDTGAMYRAIALYMNQMGIDYENEAVVSEQCEAIEVTITYESGEQQVLLNGVNVSSLIRSERIGEIASKVSTYPAVREKLLNLQRDLAKKENVIMDGRDIGTCVLPNADLKIYLTADAGIRADRRCRELREKGIACEYETVKADIIERDNRDMHRVISPLKKAEDAVEVDTSHMSIAEVIETIESLIRKFDQKKD